MTLIGNHVNGVDLGILQNLVDSVKADPAEGVAEFIVNTRWTGGAASETAVNRWRLGSRTMTRGFRIRTDEPPELCGGGAAPNPQEALMAAMNACIMVGFVALCSLEGVELKMVEIETRGELDLRGFLGLDPAVKPGYDEVRFTLRAKAQAPREKVERIFDRAMRTSPNFFNISSPVRLVPELELV